MEDNTVKNILNQTKDNYTRLAVDWDRTRRQLSDGMEDFLNYIKPGDKLLDAGCGNGRIVKLFDDVKIDYVGLDNNLELLNLAKTNFPKSRFVLGEMTDLPFANEQFDSAVCVSALHHLPGTDLRLKAVRELARVLKPKGFLILSNWSWRSPKIRQLLFKYTIAKILGQSDLDFGDIYIGWSDTKVKRYIHLFSATSIRKLAKQAGLEVVKSTISAPTKRGFKNIVTIVQK